MPEKEADRREEILKSVFEAYKKAHPKDSWLSFDEVKSCGTADIVFAAMDEYMKECCLELLEFMAKNDVTCTWYEHEVLGVQYCFVYKGEDVSKEQLFESFL